MKEFLKALFEAKEATLVAGDKTIKIKQVDVNENTCKGCVFLNTHLNAQRCSLHCLDNKQFRIVED